METYSSIFAWENPMDREAWRDTVYRSQGVGHNWATQHSTTITN